MDKKMFSYWIQLHDYSVRDFEDVTVDQAVRAFEEFDWAAEIAKMHEAEDGCPSGIGIHNGGRANAGAVLLHVCPWDSRFATVHFDYPVKRRLLGLFPRMGSDSRSRQQYPRSSVPNLIRLLFELQVDEIIHEMDRSAGHSAAADG